MRAVCIPSLVLAIGCSSSGSPADSSAAPVDVNKHLAALVLKEGEAPPPKDITNKYSEDPSAAVLGKKFFFDPRFSGPLLDSANIGDSQTLGKVGETGKVACAGCHVPENGSYVDTRSARGQVSLGAGWTHRRTPAIPASALSLFQTWGGRRDTAYSVVFGVIESPLEFNSSRLFVAQTMASLYADEYASVFGPLPDLSAYAPVAPSDAGCANLDYDATKQACPKPETPDDAVTRVAVNFGKAIGAYTRLLTCGRSRFDDWMEGDATALTESEQAGATLFVKSGCDTCHSGPHFTDLNYHNVAVKGELLPFTGVDTRNDHGAADGLAAVQTDPLNSRGIFSDGDDGRLDTIPSDLSSLVGAFRTPSLRCIGTRPSFFHDGTLRTLPDVVRHFNEGGDDGAPGTKEIQPLGLTPDEIDQLAAFLKALDGPGPGDALRTPPALPD